MNRFSVTNAERTKNRSHARNSKLKGYLEENLIQLTWNAESVCGSSVGNSSLEVVDEDEPGGVNRNAGLAASKKRIVRP